MISSWLCGLGNYKWYFETDARSHSGAHESLVRAVWHLLVRLHSYTIPRKHEAKQNVFIGTLQPPNKEIQFSACRAPRNKWEAMDSIAFPVGHLRLISDCPGLYSCSPQITISPPERRPGTIRFVTLKLVLFHQMWDSLAVLVEKVHGLQAKY